MLKTIENLAFLLFFTKRIKLLDRSRIRINYRLIESRARNLIVKVVL